jgi:hypothetical protein
MRQTLPEKWCVKPKTKAESKIIFKYKGISEYKDAPDVCYYQHYPPINTFCTAYEYVQKDYEEITLEEFQVLVLGEKLKEISYEIY